ncbi:MAG: SpaA isopeptide-forming pilin-related protein, partial [Acidobacteria bacterium]|nr:SpaA isopeptide-forming pilin-related protein [Acidobacteriota bacterium]
YSVNGDTLTINAPALGGDVSVSVYALSVRAAGMEIMPTGTGLTQVNHTRSSDQIFYGYYTSYYTANGNTAFCLDPTLHGINTGTYPISRYLQRGSGSDLLIKCAYYLYGGPGYNGIKNSLFSNPDSMESYGLCHAAASYAYLGDSDAFKGLDSSTVNDLIRVLNIVNAQPMPPVGFDVFIYNEGSSTSQPFLGWDLTPTGSVEIIKTSSNPAMSDNNPCYSLAGAVFDVYDSANQKVGSITTNASGRGRLDGIPAVTGYYIVEVKPPQGFAGNSDRVSFSIMPDQTSTVTVSNIPQNDPVGILLRKQDADTSTATPQGNAGLAGAEFTVRYYRGLYTSAGQLSGLTPDRTWVLRTGANGTAYLNAAYLVSGDPFYYATNGDPTIPLGTVTVQETKAPEGYLINNELFIRQITSSGTAESVRMYNAPIVPDNVIRGGVSIEKWDFELNRRAVPQGDATLAGSVLEIINRSTNSVVVGGQSYAPGAVVHTMTTDASGTATTANNLLPYGNYEIIEKTPPTGYLNTGVIRQTFEIRENNAVVNLKTSETTIKNHVVRGGVEIEKWDFELNRRAVPQGDATLEGAVLEIWNRSANVVVVSGVEYAPNTVVHTLITDANGWAGTTNNLLPYGSYEIIEKTPPTGYLNTGVIKQSFQVCVDGTIVSLKTSGTTIKNEVIRGGVEIEKWDIERDERTLKQGDATLEGAVLEIWNRSANVVVVGGVEYAPDTVVFTMTTDSDGWAGTEFDLLPYGSYEIIEKTPPTGYLNTGIISRSFEIRENNVVVNMKSSDTVIKNDVIRGGVMVEKWDNEIDEHRAQGGATLEGAVFEIVNRSADSVLVEGVLYNVGEVVYTFSTDETGTATTPIDLLPYGTYQVREIAPPTGYLATGVLSRTFVIREHGVIVELNASDTAIKNDPIRGDIKGVKISDGDHKRLANVPFRITSVTTGEFHVVVTDVNGQFDTSSNWNPHSQNTNRGETDRDGVWFGELWTLDDNKGALLYDTYIIEELRCESNQGYELLIFEVSVYRHNTIIDLGTLTNDYIAQPEIFTTARDQETNTGSAVVSETTTIIDTIYFSGLKVGQDYQLNGILMVKETGEPLLVGGAPVTVEKTFRALAESGSVAMEFTFDSTSLIGKAVVVFESLEYGGVEIASHADINDEGQTVVFEEPEAETPDPKIGTSAAGPNGEKELDVGSEVTLIDTVSYVNLIPQKTYVLKGVLMDNETGEPLLIGGEPVTAVTTFTPETA